MTNRKESRFVRKEFIRKLSDGSKVFAIHR